MVESLAKWQIVALELHKSFGVLVLALVVLRLVVRVRSVVPSLPKDLPVYQVIAARVSHVLLYAGMLLMPLSGWLMQNAAGRPFDVFGALVLPALIGRDLALYGLFREMHAVVAIVFAVVVVVHVLAALYHGFVRRDSVLESMM